MNNQTEIETTIRERLEEIKAIPARNPQAAARGRARFLAQAAAAREARQQPWWGSIFRVRQLAMNMAVTLLLIVGMLVGGGTTVKAAQDDLPGELLYPVKIFSEDISLRFQSNPEDRADRLIELAEIRVQEMSRLIEAGQTPPAQVSLRLEGHLQQAFQLYGDMDEATLKQKLPQLRAHLQQQERDVERLQAHAGQAALPALEHTHTMLQSQLQVVEEGLADQETFRDNVDNGLHYGQTQTPPVEAPPITVTAVGEQNGQATTPPGQGNGAGPNIGTGEPHPHVTPTPKNEHPTPVGNGGGNDKDKGKDKDPKDKDPGKPGDKPPK